MGFPFTPPPPPPDGNTGGGDNPLTSDFSLLGVATTVPLSAPYPHPLSPSPPPHQPPQSLRGSLPRRGALPTHRLAPSRRSSALAAAFSHADPPPFTPPKQRQSGGIASPCQHTPSLAPLRRGGDGPEPRKGWGGRSHRREGAANPGNLERVLRPPLQNPSTPPQINEVAQAQVRFIARCKGEAHTRLRGGGGVGWGLFLGSQMAGMESRGWGRGSGMGLELGEGGCGGN